MPVSFNEASRKQRGGADMSAAAKESSRIMMCRMLNSRADQTARAPACECPPGSK